MDVELRECQLLVVNIITSKWLFLQLIAMRLRQLGCYEIITGPIDV